METKQRLFGVTEEKPRPTIDIYYRDSDGKVMGISPSRASMPEFAQYDIKTVSWDEGSVFLNGEKNIGEYFINTMSVRKEIVKRNLVQLYGNDNHVNFFDLSDHGVMVDDKKDADLLIHYTCWENGAWGTCLSILPNNIQSEDVIIHATEYRKPMNHFSSFEINTPQILFQFNAKASFYLDFDHYRKIKVFTSTTLHVELEISCI